MCAAAHRTPCKVSLRRRAAPVAIRSPRTAPAVMPPAAPFLSAAKENRQISCLAFAASLRLIPRRAARLCSPGLTVKTSVSTVFPGDISIFSLAPLLQGLGIQL